MGEVEGEDYRFVSTSEFDAMVERGEFIEWATIGGHRYGTTVASVQALAAEGKVCVLDVDVQGAIAARSDLRPYCVWVAPPSFGALRERLTERGTESEEEISRRVLRAREEIEFSLTTRCFDKVIVNDDFDAASRELREAVLEALAPSA
uniref:Guanylate kinase-like domain-containing protein n=1 Tax=Emiliania huxleyi (strain CCMP1516) TaxID=280463 RepID=A0A0D3JJC7_EMIH1